MINGWIEDAHDLEVREMALERAKAAGAVAMFGEKYDQLVRVVDVPGVSMELCGGTHVANTAEIGVFRIISESGVAAGIRRIEAVAGTALLPYLRERDAVVRELMERFKVQPAEISQRVSALADELRTTQKALVQSRADLAVARSFALLEKARAVGSFRVLVERFDGVQAAELQNVAQSLRENLGEAGAVVLGGLPDPADLSKVTLVAAFGKDVIAAGLQAGRFIGGIAKICGGGGGGRPQLAQAGGKEGTMLDGALEKARDNLSQSLPPLS
jgi:alanyl-tRNA synthetase